MNQDEDLLNKFLKMLSDDIYTMLQYFDLQKVTSGTVKEALDKAVAEESLKSIEKAMMFYDIDLHCLFNQALRNFAETGNNKMIELLLEVHADPNVGIVGAIQLHRYSTLDILLETGKISSISATEALEIAFDNNDCIVVKLLLDKSSPDLSVNTDKYLVSAIKMQMISAVSRLLKAGANIDTHCGAPLLSAVQRNNRDLVTLLLSNGANPNICRGVKLITVACEWASIGIIQELLEYGLYIDSKDATRIFLQVTSKLPTLDGQNYHNCNDDNYLDIDMIEFLLIKGIEDTSQLNIFLNHASQYGILEFVKLFVEHGISLLENKGEAIRLAAEGGYFHVEKYLRRQELAHRAGVRLEKGKDSIDAPQRHQF